MIAAGSRLGPYVITAPIGAGGMGEVYKATDTRLKRDVALKILPESFATDSERLARFQREAEVLASLNHPNIAAIHGLEDSNGTRALVMELVEGETLADRLARGPIPIDEALPIAKQIAEALEAAHEQGIIHRDLKPANIKVRPDGTVKVLDFGLAKALEPASVAGVGATASPTITSPALMTGVGVLLGTAAYMSPEQARGREADRRADIWAFGCVFFEMLTGRRAFHGEDTTETLAEVIKSDPGWGSLPADTPSFVRTLLRRCLRKDPRTRLPHIGLARLDLEEMPATNLLSLKSGTAALDRRRAVGLGTTIAAVVGATVTAAGATWWLTRGAADAPVVTRTSIGLPSNVELGTGSPGLQQLLSPDGRQLAFLGREGSGVFRLWIRSLDSLVAEPLAGTERVQMAAWAPNSRSLAFVAAGQLRKIDIAGGPPITITERATNTGLAWSVGDVILFSPERGALFSVPAAGGMPVQVTTLDAAAGDRGHWNPYFLPDGRHFLYSSVGSPETPDVARAVYVASLDPGVRPKMLVAGGGSNPQYASGRLLFLREGTLMAQPFDPERLELSGEAVPLVRDVLLGGQTGNNGAFSVSENGVLVYQTTSARGPSQLTWFDRSGNALGTLGEPGYYGNVELSPDASRVLVNRIDPAVRTRDLWILDVRRGLATRFTFDPSDDGGAVWSPDGSRIVYDTRRGDASEMYIKPSSGLGDEASLGPRVQGGSGRRPFSWSSDGNQLLYEAGIGTNVDLWVLPVSSTAVPRPLLQSRFNEIRGRFSTDGRWVTYSSNESGQNEVYVVPYPDLGEKWQISSGGGSWSRWRRDSKELFYLSANNEIMSVGVTISNGKFEVDTPRPLFTINPFVNLNPFDVTPDGQRFLVNGLLEDPESPLTLLVNWPALLTD